MLKSLGVNLKAFYFRFKAQPIREEEDCNKLTINCEIYNMLLFMTKSTINTSSCCLWYAEIYLMTPFMIYKFCFLSEASCPPC